MDRARSMAESAAAAFPAPEDQAESETNEQARRRFGELVSRIGGEPSLERRLKDRVRLEELLRAIPDYRVAADEIEWFRTPSVRGPARLPIEFTPARA